jgi:hypothetical protein
MRPLGAAAVVIFLAAVAAGAGALRTGDETVPERTAWTLPLLISVTGLSALVCFAAVGYAYWPSRRWKDEKDQPRRYPLWAKVGIVVFILLVIMAAWMFVVATSHPRQPPSLPGTQLTTTTLGTNLPTTTAPPAAPERPLRLAWWMAAGSVVLAGAMATGLVLLTKGRKWGEEQAAPPPPAPARSVATRAVDRSIEALAAEEDARRAVIAAYESMEHALAESGMPRSQWETPFEYVDRILLELGATADTAARLTELFEEAKFSSHAVGLNKKTDALDALNTLRLELVAA